MKAKYRVHRVDIAMSKDQGWFEQFLNSLEGEVVSVNPKRFSKLDLWRNGRQNILFLGN